MYMKINNWKSCHLFQHQRMLSLHLYKSKCVPLYASRRVGGFIYLICRFPCALNWTVIATLFFIFILFYLFIYLFFGQVIQSTLLRTLEPLTILCLKMECPLYYLLICLKRLGDWQTVLDPDQTPRSAASDLGPHCLLRPVISEY